MSDCRVSPVVGGPPPAQAAKVAPRPAARAPQHPPSPPPPRDSASDTSNMAAAKAPMSRIGRRTELNEGHSRDASGESSKPTTERSSGMDRPRRKAAL